MVVMAPTNANDPLDGGLDVGGDGEGMMKTEEGPDEQEKPKVSCGNGRHGVS